LDFGEKRAALGMMKIMVCLAASLAMAPPRVLAVEKSRAATEKTSESRAFSMVPVGDVLYKNLSALESAGWIQSSGATSARTQLTRYEIAVETAKAVFYGIGLLCVAAARNRARQRADFNVYSLADARGSSVGNVV